MSTVLLPLCSPVGPIEALDLGQEQLELVLGQIWQKPFKLREARILASQLRGKVPYRFSMRSATASSFIWLKSRSSMSQMSRTYFFPRNGEVIQFTVWRPAKLNVKRKPDGDSHRIVDVDGVAYYIPSGWIALRWEGKNGEAFSF